MCLQHTHTIIIYPKSIPRALEAWEQQDGERGRGTMLREHTLNMLHVSRWAQKNSSMSWPTECNGLAYCLGSQDKECWYLYTWSSRGIGGDEEEVRGPDQTLEILMSELDPMVMSIFTREESSSAAEATQKSGIANLIPNMVIDDYLFEPCGYSMNGIAKSGCYMTIHITPEPEFSYVSFECNVPQASYKEVISRVLETFQPGKFVLTVFANKASVASDAPQELQKIPAFGDWLRHDMQYCRLQNYDFIYAFYSKFPS
uniref:S-adenosylmethionine decarboxylase proenzyme n=1 Tax=Timema cristinae TaxID=61476 RepID=A0A7R9CVE6_TIMCR|nr:unnamed protein product [Timema cristinae]